MIQVIQRKKDFIMVWLQEFNKRCKIKNFYIFFILFVFIVLFLLFCFYCFVFILFVFIVLFLLFLNYLFDSTFSKGG